MSQWWDTYGWWMLKRVGPLLLLLLISIVMAVVSIRRRYRDFKRTRQRGFEVLSAADESRREP